MLKAIERVRKQRITVEKVATIADLRARRIAGPRRAGGKAPYRRAGTLPCRGRDAR